MSGDDDTHDAVSHPQQSGRGRLKDQSPPPRTISRVNVYAGIGSRRTPPVYLEYMRELAYVLAVKGWTLRTGGAPGADTAFEEGHRRYGFGVELFLPSLRFNGHQAARLYGPTEDAFLVAARYHPAWDQLTPEARILHARNAHIILGAELDDPVTMVVCWTPDGSLDGTGPDSGGTGQALRIAADHRIPVFNLARDEHMDRIGRLLGDKYTSPRLFTA